MAIYCRVQIGLLSNDLVNNSVVSFFFGVLQMAEQQLTQHIVFCTS